jgi:hypothetical protein
MIKYCSSGSLSRDTLLTSRVRFYTYIPSVITHANNTSFPKSKKRRQAQLKKTRPKQKKELKEPVTQKCPVNPVICPAKIKKKERQNTNPKPTPNPHSQVKSPRTRN